MRALLVLCLLIVLFSCKEEERTPDYVITSEEFVEILTEFQEAEAIVRLGYHRTADSLIYNDSIYASFFRKHKISEAIFDSNYNYYSDRPKKFEKMYEQVIINLSTRSAELLEKHPEDSTSN